MSLCRILVMSCHVVMLAVGSARAEPPVPKDGPLGMKFVPLPKGTFYMGGGGGKAGKKTEIKESFEIAVHEVTQAQWRAVMGDNPSYFSREGKGKEKVKDIKEDDLRHFPVESVSWHDVQAFLKKLNEKEKGKGYLYRLPTEVEWEYACRGGASSEKECSFHCYLDKPVNDLSSRQANFNGLSPLGDAPKGKSLGRPARVGSYSPNKLGLYDMHGNILEWCQDGDPGSSDRVCHGGSWNDVGYLCRSADRSWYSAGYRFRAHGFRLVRAPVR